MAAMVGFCKVEVKPFGPVHAKDSASVAPPVNVKVLPSQIGLGAAEALTAVGTLQPMQPKATQVFSGAPLNASKHRVLML